MGNYYYYYYYHYHYYFCLMAIYPGNWVSQFPFGLSPPPVPEENLWGLVEWVFLWAWCPSCHPTISVKALKETQSTNCNQWPGFILSL